LKGTIEIAGPERSDLTELAQRYLTASNDSRKVIANIFASYFGTELNNQSLVPISDARIGATQFETWLSNMLRTKSSVISNFASGSN